MAIAGVAPIDDAALRFAKSLSPVPSSPVDPTNALESDPQAALLGHMLFFDTGLSRSGETSCATCHVPAKAFTDGVPLARGAAEGHFNTPTLLGAAHNRWFFWDGRADSLWSQALVPIEHQLELDNSRTDALRHIASTPALKKQFIAVGGTMPDVFDLERFPIGAKPGTDTWNAMTPEDQNAVTAAYVLLGKAIASFERQLSPGESDFDRWVASINANQRDDNLMTPAALRGFALFANEAGCGQCHFGATISDLEFHDLALAPTDPANPPPGRGGGYATLRANEFRSDGIWSDAPESRKARRAANARIGPEHWGAFRTPSLRNIALTAPYMHDGRFETLAEVLAFYNTLEGQIRRHHHAEDVLKPLDFSDSELRDLEAFLISLTGEPPRPELCQPPPIGGTQVEIPAE